MITATALIALGTVFALTTLIDGNPMDPEPVTPEPTPEPTPAPVSPSPVPATDLISAWTQAAVIRRRAQAIEDEAASHLAAMLVEVGPICSVDVSVIPPAVTVFAPTMAAPGFEVTKPKHESSVTWTPRGG